MEDIKKIGMKWQEIECGKTEGTGDFLSIIDGLEESSPPPIITAEGSRYLQNVGNHLPD